MRKLNLVALLAIMLFTGSCVNPDKQVAEMPVQSLKLTLGFNQSTYHVGESVIAVITLENIGSETITINSRMSFNLPFMTSPIREIAFIVITPSGENYMPNAYYTPRGLGSKLFIELMPGEKFETVIYLDVEYYEFTEVGIYKITANYQNSVDPSYANREDHRIAWKGELTSNEVLLTIIP